MAEENQDNSQKTEEPSSRRLEEARKGGQVISSRELISFLLFTSTALIIYFLFGPLFEKTQLLLRNYISAPHEYILDGNSALEVFVDVIKITLGLALIPLVINSLVIILGNFFQHGGFIFSAKSIIPQLNRISIFSGMERLFSLNSVIEFVKSILKLLLVGATAFFAIKSNFSHIQSTYNLEFSYVLEVIFEVTMSLLFAVCSMMLVIAAFDYMYKRYEYLQKLRMSRYEVKEEHKRMEGNPEIKSKIKKLMVQVSKSRILTAVPKADVVITNPTHYAVALEYNSSMQAPKVISKGQDIIAQRIKQIARDSFIPIVENPPLARALYSVAEIDQLIPLEHYKAVAEVISYVMKIRADKRRKFSKKDRK